MSLISVRVVEGAKRSKFKSTIIYTEFTYFWHRWYSSDDGRWVSRDPIGVAGGINVYGYVGVVGKTPCINTHKNKSDSNIRSSCIISFYQHTFNSPINWIDYDGEKPIKFPPFIESSTKYYWEGYKNLSCKGLSAIYNKKLKEFNSCKDKRTAKELKDFIRNNFERIKKCIKEGWPFYETY
ncbi:MAG: RHS repeat domain-containing protein [archaeon]